MKDNCEEYAVRTGSVGIWAGQARKLGTEDPNGYKSAVEGQAAVAGFEYDLSQLRQTDAT